MGGWGDDYQDGNSGWGNDVQESDASFSEDDSLESNSGWGNDMPVDNQQGIQGEPEQPSGGSNMKVVAIIIAVTVALLLIVAGVSSCGKRKNNITQSTQQASSQVDASVMQDDTTEQITETTEATSEQIIEQTEVVDTQAVSQEQPVATEQPTTEAQVQPSVSIAQPKVVDENTLNYGEQELSVSGVVTNKQLLDVGTNQYVYCVEITSVLGNNSVVFEYYCTKNTFDSLVLNDILVVNYKQVAEDKFVICSALK